MKQSDIEATALGKAAQLAAEFKAHKQHCSRCTNATKGKVSANCCEDGWYLLLEIRKQNRIIDQVQLEKAARLGEQLRIV